MFTHLVYCLQVGGWHVSQFLKQALSWRDQKEAATATTSSLDASHVKQRCRWGGVVWAWCQKKNISTIPRKHFSSETILNNLKDTESNLK